MIIKDSIRFVIASIAMVLFVLFGCGSRVAYAQTSTVTPEMSKTINKITVEGEEDAYELSLSIKTTKKILEQTAPLDVIFIADLSGSMDDETSGGSTRLKDLKKALTADGGLIESVLSNPENRLAIVSFAGGTQYTDYHHYESQYDDAKTVLPWSSSTDIAKQKAKELAVPSNGDTGTNISAGLYEAEKVLNEARDTAKKVIVLLTDGAANMYYDEDGYTQYGGNNPSSSFVEKINESLESEVNKLKAHNLDGFYSIAFANTTAVSSLTTIYNAWGEYFTEENNKIFSAKNISQLIDRFEEIVNSIKTLMFQNIEITDILSDWVELISGEASNFSVVQIAKGDTEDKATELSSNVVTIKTTTDNNKTQVSATFAKDFDFQDGYTYILKFKVRISQDGYDKFADTGCDKLPSNDKATVSYTYDGITQEVEFNVPTIDSVTLDIPIKVEWDMLDGQETSETSVAVKLFQDGGEKSYRKEDVTGDMWTSSFTSVAKGHTYAVEAPDVVGFTKTVENVGTEAKPEFVVTYVQLPSLTISKTLIEEGEKVESGDSGESFKMTVTLTDEKGRALDGKYGGYTFDSKGQTTVSVPAGGSIKLAYLPRGTQYTVVETAESSAGYDVAYKNATSTLDKTDKEVTVTNTKLPSLTISKTVAGDYGDKGREFTFTITLTNDGSKVSDTFTMTKGDNTEDITFSDGTATVTLKHGESVVIKDLPLGASYTVEETADSRSGYTVTYNSEQKDNTTGTLTKSAKVDVINTMGNITSTGGNSSHGSAVKLGVLGGLAVLVTLALVARKVRKDDL